MRVNDASELERFAPYEVIRMQVAVSTVAGEGRNVVSLLTRIRGAEGEEMDIDLVLLDTQINMFDIGADLLGAADGIVHQLNIEAGLDRQQGEKIRRKLRRAAEHDRRIMAEHVVHEPELHCNYCPRGAAVIVDGVRYCKRHAEEHGVREKGKIS